MNLTVTELFFFIFFLFSTPFSLLLKRAVCGVVCVVESLVLMTGGMTARWRCWLLAAGVWRTGTGGVAHRLQSFFKSLLLALLSV